MKNVLILMLLVILSGCAVVDISTLDTAVPLPPKDFKIGIYESVGLDISSAVFNEYDGDDQQDNLIGYAVVGTDLALGLPDDMELGSRFYIGPFNGGVRLYLKKLLMHEKDTRISILPAFTYVYESESDDTDEWDKFNAYGAEVQVIYTYTLNKHLAVSGAVRGNYSRYTEKRHDNQSNSPDVLGPYNVLHGGFRANLELQAGGLYFIPEVGVEFAPIVNGRFGVLPTVGVGLGLKL